MKVLVFAKKRKTKEGRPFTSYVTKMKKKDGSEVFATVKFREECGNPKPEDCPLYINVKKADANMSTKTVEVVGEDGEMIETERKTLWVNAWERDPEIYVDTSLDDFED